MQLLLERQDQMTAALQDSNKVLAINDAIKQLCLGYEIVR